MSLAEHLIRASSHNVVLWRDFLLRSAGFPASWASELDSSSAIEAALALHQAEQHHRELVRGARRTLTEAARVAERSDKRALRRLVKRLGRADLATHLVDVDLATRERLEPLLEAANHLQRARSTYEETYRTEQARLVARLREILRRGRLREAIVWESPGALDGIDRFLQSDPDDLTKKSRLRLRTAISYLQRLCAKNDSIGFFGPIAWGRWSDAEDSIELQVEEPLVRRHEHYFEPRALSNISRALGADPRSRVHLPVRRLPSLAIEDERVRLPLQPPQSRTPAEIAALSLADGSVDTPQLIAVLRERGLADDAEAAALLQRLEAEGLLTRSAELPQIYDAEAVLEQWLDRAPPEAAEPHRERLRRVLGARERIAESCGDADAVREGIRALERLFEDETGVGRQGGGRFYEARSPLFQEAERNVRLRLGKKLLDELAAALDVLSPVVFWYTQTLAERVEAYAARLLEDRGAPAVELLQMQFELLPELPSIAEATAQEMRKRWTRATDGLTNDGRLDPACARRGVDKFFSRPPTRWEFGRRASPDLMIAARSVEAIRRGEYVFVLGEIHVAANSLMQGCFLWARDAADVVRQTKLDSTRPSLALDLADSVYSVRLNRPHDADGLKWVIAHTRNAKWSNSSVVPLAALSVERDPGGGVYGHCRVSGRRWPLADILNPALNFAALSAFRLTDGNERTERLQLGHLVLQRAQWIFSAEALAFAGLRSAAERFAAVIGWMQEYGLPRHVFLKVKSEMKPIYCDLHSPLYVELLVKLVRGLPAGESVKLVEMLPGPEELWLVDTAGQHYTSELRVVMVDQA